MADHPNVEVVRRLLDAFNSGDMEAGRALFADDVVWHTIGGPTLEGVGALEESMGGDSGDMSVTANVHDIIGNDEHVVALVEATATAGDETFEYRTAEILHVSNGKVTERWAFSDDTQRITDWFSKFA
ncbi:MAG: nuclear transport factor 2 family protein [Acidimicrobiia bacterium]|jgi:ketosteroid isomerase-like protein